MKIRVITKSAQAVENIIRFQKEVLSNKKQNVLVDTLSHFRAWYAIQHNGHWIFAPSKFIGYVDFDAHKYGENNRQIDGRVTEVALRPWFQEVNRNQLGEELQEQLVEFLASFGKQPNSLARISILSENIEEQSQPKIGWVDAMLALYEEMPEEAKNEFRRRVKSI